MITPINEVLCISKTQNLPVHGLWIWHDYVLELLLLVS